MNCLAQSAPNKREWIKPCGFLSFLTFALQKQRQKYRISFCYLNQQTTWNLAEINVITQVLCSVQAATSETELLGQHEDKCAGNKRANLQPPNWNCVSNVDAFWKDFHCPSTALLGTLGWTQVCAFRAVSEVFQTSQIPGSCWHMFLILIEAAIRKWVHCVHKRMDMVSNDI